MLKERKVDNNTGQVVLSLSYATLNILYNLQLHLNFFTHNLLTFTYKKESSFQREVDMAVGTMNKLAD